VVFNQRKNFSTSSAVHFTNTAPFSFGSEVSKLESGDKAGGTAALSRGADSIVEEDV
jgi:hypothetical protein